MPVEDSSPKWTASQLEAQQSALFDVCMGEIVSSLKAVDQPRHAVYLHRFVGGYDWDVRVDAGEVASGEIIAGPFATCKEAERACEVLNHG